MSYKINGIEMVTASEIVEATGWTKRTIDRKMKRFNYAHISLKPKEIKGLYERYGRVWNGCPSKLNLYPLSVKEELVSMSKRRRNPLNALATIPAVEKEKEETTIKNSVMTQEISALCFENKEFGALRSIVKGGLPWFVGIDVAKALGYTDVWNAIRDHVDDDDKISVKRSKGMAIFQSCQNDKFSASLDTIGFTVPPRGLTVINESGMYSLILSSKLPSAKRFKHWVTSEVLPSIRKTGKYEDAASTVSTTPSYENLSPTVRALIEIDTHCRDNENEVTKLKEEVDELKSLVSSLKSSFSTIGTLHTTNWREECVSALRSLSPSNNEFDYTSVYNKAYRELEKVCHCNLWQRVSNIKNRMRKQGATRTMVEKIGRMDAIERSSDLKEPFINIVERMVGRSISKA